jgi:hypothetical protein
MAIKHAFTSTQPDGPDPAKVRASNWNADHTIDDGTLALAKLASIATDRVIGRASAGTGAPELITVTAAGRNLLDDADAAAQRTTLGLGSAALAASGAFAPAVHGHIIGDVTGLQTALDSKLDDSQATAFGLSLLGNADAAAARATLALGTAATQAATAFEAAGAAATAAAGAVTTHEAASNPHPIYLTQTEADALYEPAGVIIADVSGLQAALDGKQAAGSYAAASHTHTASQITDFATAADARVAAASIDALADVTVTSPATGQVLKYNGSAWVNDTDATGSGGAAVELATFSVTPARFQHAVAIVAAIGVTPSTRIVGPQLQPNEDWDADDLADMTVTAQPLTNQIEFTINRPGPMVGNFAISYIAG